MAVTNEKSTQVTNEDATPRVNNPAYEAGNPVRYRYFTFTQGAAAGDATSTALLCRIPAGQGHILPAMSRVSHSAFGAARTLDVGIEAHTNRDLTTAVAKVADNILDGLDVSAAGASDMGSGTNADGASIPYDVSDVEGVDILATVNVDTIPAAATLTGWIAYVPNQ